MLHTRPPRAWLILGIVLLALLGAAVYIVQDLWQKSLATAHGAAERELGLLASLVKNDLLRSNYQQASATLVEWGEANADIVSLRLQSDNGFLISTYQRAQPGQMNLSLTTSIQYSYAGEAQLSFVKDLAPLERDRNLLILQLGAAYLVLAGLCIALTRSTLLYHKESIALRARSRELDRSNADLRQVMTQRQQVEGERDRLVSILEATTDLVSLADPAGHVLYLNQAGRRLTGLGNRALGTLQIPNVHPAWAAELIQREGLPAAIRDGHWSGETALLGPDGEEIPVSQVILSHRDAQGELQYLSTIMRDISERKRSEYLLRQSERYNRMLFESSPIGLALCRMDGTLVDINPAYAAIIGRTVPETLKMSYWEITPEKYSATEAAQLESLEKTGRYGPFEKEYIHKDGTLVPVLLQGLLIEREGEKYIWSSVEDITERKNAEEELRRHRDHLEELVQERTTDLRRHTIALESANKELEAFSYSVSHDLRGPLRGIDGFSQALLEDYGDRLDATGKDYLGRVRSGIQRMSLLIDDLLKLSRLSRAPLQPQTVDLSTLALDILQHLRAADPERAVQAEVMPGLSVQGDPGLLRAALENLLSNAWKYSSKTLAARIEFGARQQAGETVYYVRDNGAGFDMAHADKLFGAFQRLHHREDFEGTGIGLATVQRIIQRHGGRIWAEAAPGQGASFYFTLGRGESNSQADRAEPGAT